MITRMATCVNKTWVSCDGDDDDNDGDDGNDDDDDDENDNNVFDKDVIYKFECELFLNGIFPHCSFKVSPWIKFSIRSFGEF